MWSGGVGALALTAAALAFLLYVRALSFEFVNWDDWEYVLLNPSLGALDREFARWSFTAFVVGNWHPATLISYGLDHALWERDPTGYHLTNVALHAANSPPISVVILRAGNWALSGFDTEIVGVSPPICGTVTTNSSPFTLARAWSPRGAIQISSAFMGDGKPAGVLPRTFTWCFASVPSQRIDVRPSSEPA